MLDAEHSLDDWHCDYLNKMRDEWNILMYSILMDFKKREEEDGNGKIISQIYTLS